MTCDSLSLGAAGSCSDLFNTVLYSGYLKSICNLAMVCFLITAGLAIDAIKVNTPSLSVWTGDPCLPSPHPWVTCGTSDLSSQPVIVAVWVPAALSHFKLQLEFNQLVVCLRTGRVLQKNLPRNSMSL